MTKSEGEPIEIVDGNKLEQDNRPRVLNLRIEFNSHEQALRYLDGIAPGLSLVGMGGASISKNVEGSWIKHDEDGQVVFEKIPQIGPRQ